MEIGKIGKVGNAIGKLRMENEVTSVGKILSFRNTIRTHEITLGHPSDSVRGSEVH